MSKLIDITGHRFGRWEVLRHEGRGRYLCRCGCGTVAVRYGSSLRAGKSSGCHSCAGRPWRVTHGGSTSRLYRIWGGMKERCLNCNSHAYYRYGGRGIDICEKWVDDFAAFQSWALANGYKRHLTLERSDNDSGYSPDNCRWATMAEQSRNRRSNIRVTIDDVEMTLSEAARLIGRVSPAIALQRVSRGQDPYLAVEADNRDARAA